MLSIIVPVYNGDDYIDGLFERFSAYEAKDFELILVDDGSIDDSYAHLQRAITAHPQLRTTLIHQENGGVSSARNRGLQAISGAFFTFVDVDDVLSSDYMAVLNTLMAEAPSVGVFCSKRVQSEAEIVEQAHDVNIEACSAETFLNRFIANPTRFGVVNLVVNTAFWREHSLRFSTGYPYYEDYDFLYRLFCVAQRVRYTDQVLYYYVNREASAMNRFSIERLRCLKLIAELSPMMSEKRPAFAPTFDRWAVSRLYWSVLWQAAVAAKSMADLSYFAKQTGASDRLATLREYPDRRVALTSKLYRFMPWVVLAAMRVMGKRRSHIKPVSLRRLLKRSDFETMR